MFLLPVASSVKKVAPLPTSNSPGVAAKAFCNDSISFEELAGALITSVSLTLSPSINRRSLSSHSGLIEKDIFDLPCCSNWHVRGSDGRARRAAAGGHRAGTGRRPGHPRRRLHPLGRARDRRVLDRFGRAVPRRLRRPGAGRQLLEERGHGRWLPGPRRERRGQPERRCTAGAPPHRPRPGPHLHLTAPAAGVSTSAALQEPSMSRAPSLFISHGSPMFSIEPGELGPNLRQLGRTLADLSAIVVVSPHWQTQGVRVGATAMPETIHDFSEIGRAHV